MQTGITQKDVCIVGGGLSGPMLGIILAKKGFNVKIFERRSDMRKVKIEAGRSINLALSQRGFAALDQIGLKEALLSISIPMVGRMIHDLEGNTSLQRYGKDDSEAIYSVSRGSLNCQLLDVLEKLPGVELYFNANCSKYDLRTNELFFQIKNEDGTKTDMKVSDHLVIAADGYSSTVRDSLSKQTRMNFSQVYETHGYKELTLQPGPNGFLLEKRALHIWPRGGFMLIALPNLDGNFTCTLFLSHENGQENFNNLNSDEKIKEFFLKYFPDIIQLMPDVVQQFKKNPIGSLCTIKCEPWYYKDKVILIGDSAHALVPFYGQGMNCAFEDCTVFSQLLEKYQKQEQQNWGDLIKEFSTCRKANTDAISDMAVKNFIEMRDLVNDKFFKLKKECEAKIAKRFPDFISKYSLVAFSLVPYYIAMKRGEVHDEILDQMCKGLEDVNSFNEEEAYQRIIQHYKEKQLQ